MDSYQNGSQKGEQDFQKLTQTVESSIQKISQNVSSMQRMVNQIGSHQDSPELRKQLHNLQHYTQQLVKDTNGDIKDLSNISPSLSQSEQRQRKMQKERLQDEFTSTLNLFQQVQRSTAQKEKDQIKKTKQQVYGDQPYLLKMATTELETIIEDQRKKLINQETFIEHLEMEMRENDEMLRENLQQLNEDLVGKELILEKIKKQMREFEEDAYEEEKRSQTVISDKESQIAVLQNKVEQLLKKNWEVKEEKLCLEKDLDKLHERHDFVTEKINRLQQENHGYQRRLTRLHSTNSCLIKTKEMEEERGKLEKEVDNLNDELNKQSQLIETLKAESDEVFSRETSLRDLIVKKKSSVNLKNNEESTSINDEVLKENVQRNRNVIKRCLSEGSLTLAGLKKDQQLIELQDSQAQRQMQIQEEADLRQLQEQEQAVRQLECDIQDVNQIFKELGQLVHEQGEVIDSIEASVESTADFVRQGAQQLREAGGYKDRIRKKKVIIASIGALILAVIIIIIVVKTS